MVEGKYTRSNIPPVCSNRLAIGRYSLGDHNNDDPQAWLDLVPDDVVAVVPNYRLGIFGFLAGEEVKKDGVLNAGGCS